MQGRFAVAKSRPLLFCFRLMGCGLRQCGVARPQTIKFLMIDFPGGQLCGGCADGLSQGAQRIPLGGALRFGPLIRGCQRIENVFNAVQPGGCGKLRGGLGGFAGNAGGQITNGALLQGHVAAHGKILILQTALKVFVACRAE